MYGLRSRAQSSSNPTASISAIFTFFSVLFLCSFKPISSNPQTHQTARSLCNGTLFPNLCFSKLSSFPQLASLSPEKLAGSALNFTNDEVHGAYANCSKLKTLFYGGLNPTDRRALDDCLELLDGSIAELQTSIYDLSPSQSAARHSHDLLTLVSAAMTNHRTCLDGFYNSSGTVRKRVELYLGKIEQHLSIDLAMLKKIPGVKRAATAEEVLPEYGAVRGGFPMWVSVKDRRLLQASVNETKFNLVVAKDGSGNFTTVGAAVAAAPNSSTTRFVIYIKAGAYFENVEIERKKTNLMFVGDGIGKTLIKADRNVVDGWTTFRSATVVAVGNGFIAKGITFENFAGPSKHQAVAFRSNSDFSAFYQCSFIGYQDTLYVHSLRQFYRECDVYGTIDFIFGNAAVIFQNCNLYARKPNSNQRNIFTAQGREDPNQNTGISILNCKVEAASDLLPVLPSFRTYLGRPWKLYSRTVFLKSFIGQLVEPVGWLEWSGTFALDTLYYGEYLNRGPGSNTTGRVTWPGYRVITNSTEASQFTVEAFIQGSEWLNSTEIPFFSGLA
ncbi:pectinesterase-like [Cucurbita moschata]|uniref:Pectinesterase n=1 Tax=Cucurbita moschata TaxID=3662 RepID=A0A6J1GNU4_CUCMO|nr:pectinesterase-like [Cucurbita moschata]